MIHFRVLRLTHPWRRRFSNERDELPIPSRARRRSVRRREMTPTLKAYMQGLALAYSAGATAVAVAWALGMWPQ